MPRLLFVLCSFFLGPSLVRAQEGLSLDPAVHYVVTGGHWSSEGADGQYRVIVRSGGFDHIVSDLYIQWIQDPRGKDDSARVRVTVKVDSLSGIWALDQPKLVCTPSCRLEVSGTDTHAMTKGRWVLTLGAPGRVTVRKA